MQWLNEGIIEEVPTSEIKTFGNYLPHRPVIKESNSTTPIRPVFDASSRMKGHPSLNQCLYSGPNLIELIPDILLRFRAKNNWNHCRYKEGISKHNSKSSDLLGLRWDTHLDVIAFSPDWIGDIRLEIITKRTMLPIAHRLFDRFGVASPAMLCSMLMLQETWKMSLGWDEEFKGSLRVEFI
ncbi:uncharacterized protein CEXT_202791 [Caerostris extrusa]|uniref:Reverse transcriptase n=1 Tax=Caerostris extrusa TaxID=172846 RepID=A0AAV4TIQ6_CAEEX|nr:uncharacterized protein CEXT_202791 [Caerostris extrusa]